MSWQDGVLEKVEQDIWKSGWSAVGVFPTYDEEQPRQYVYTVGLTELDHPEVIVMGLQLELAHSILWTVYERVKAGERFAHDERASELIEGFDMEFRELPDYKPLFVAHRYYEAVADFSALHLVWPDMNGVFPGEEGCDWATELMQDIEPARRV